MIIMLFLEKPKQYQKKKKKLLELRNQFSKQNIKSTLKSASYWKKIKGSLLQKQCKCFGMHLAKEAQEFNNKKIYNTDERKLQEHTHI